MLNTLKKIVRRILRKSSQDVAKTASKDFCKRYLKWSFHQGNCKNFEQYEACITRLYHTIEKGLAYLNYRPGFGQDNVDALISHLKTYADFGYDTTAFFYETALSCLQRYIQKNKEYGRDNPELEMRVSSLPGTANQSGGEIAFTPLDENAIKEAGFLQFSTSRHSLRHFSDKPVAIGRIRSALELAQHTPSACNRQGWSVKVIADKELLAEVLKWQNGNSGFGHEFDKLLVVVGDLRAFNSERELFQVFIDGGMYAMNVLHGLHYEHIASVPLSASLTKEQERHVRKLIQMEEPEVLIMFIGIGNYPNDEECLTTKSERHEQYTIVIQNGRKKYMNELKLKVNMNLIGGGYKCRVKSTPLYAASSVTGRAA